MSGIDGVLDTNVVIGLLKGAEAARALVQQTGLSLDRAAISRITRMELLGFAGLGALEVR